MSHKMKPDTDTPEGAPAEPTTEVPPPFIGSRPNASAHAIPRGEPLYPGARYEGDAGSSQYPSGSAPKRHSS